MSSFFHEMEWYAGTLRAWHLAILRYAVTLDNADRLAVIRIAGEIDRLGRRRDGRAGFEFFRRASAELCAAILQPHEFAPAVLRHYLARMDDDRLKRAFAAVVGADQPTVLAANRPPAAASNLWKGLSSRSNH